MTPTQEYRRIEYRVPTRPLKGLDSVVNSLIGAYRRRKRVLLELDEQAGQVDRLEKEWQTVSDHILRQKLRAFAGAFRRGGTAKDDALVPALAAVREAAARRVGLRPFPVQLMGALALHRGLLAEMATGEGKTLTAGLAAVLAGWTRYPCHVITVNDYLVTRDPDWLKNLYEFCGLQVGWVTGTMSPVERREGHGCDVTYTTSKELLADFLRDRIRLGGVYDPARRLIRQMLRPQMAAQEGLVMRGLHTAIVDEADSVLIDEAVTPLIISTTRGNELLREAGLRAQEIASRLESEKDYHTNLRYKEIEFTANGRRKIDETCASLPGLWRGSERRIELVRQAIVAREFFHPGKQYIISDGKVVIVDEFTGRPLPQRTWRQGLHQAIEAKEGLEISDPTETIARLSFQRFFRCFHNLSGMTGTAREASDEFWSIYNLAVITIPTNKPCIRQQWPDRFFADDTSKWNAIVEDIERVHATGRPILIGTRSVDASERLASMLKDRRLDCRVLNAVRLLDEAQIIADAGIPDRITIATNMAGRGTDIRLDRGVAELGGLHVIATERHESGRVDRQLFGRSARQGDPGSAQAFVSAEDELFRRFLSRPARQAVYEALRKGVPGAEKLARAALLRAQRNAQDFAYKQRRNVLRMDRWLDRSLSFAGPEPLMG